MTMHADYAGLIAQLQDEYTRRFSRSATLDQEAQRCLVDGATHMARHWAPYPFRYTAAQGAYVQSVDGPQVLDFWQGHYTNILGHNSPVVTEPLAQAFAGGWGLQTGIPDELEAEVGALVAERTGAERVRFTTSGSLSTMYAIMMARAYTGRHLVLKIAGGWHGAQPWALKGISPHGGSYNHLESEGLPDHIEGEVRVTRYNDSDELADIFKREGDKLACFILEPWLGTGYIGAQPEYLKLVRELTARHGVVMILDEVIAGFRFRAGNVGAMYGVQPDLMTLGKIVGGGMPLAAVAGRAEVMNLCQQGRNRRVRFDGGTYSAHPATLLAGQTMMRYLVEHEAEVYPRLAELGEKTRRGLEQAFAAHGIAVRCTGDGNAAVPGSSLGGVQFPYDPSQEITCAAQASDPALCNLPLREQVLKLGLLVQDVNVVHGLGALSMAHTDADVERLLTAADTLAARIQKG